LSSFAPASKSRLSQSRSGQIETNADIKITATAKKLICSVSDRVANGGLDAEITSQLQIATSIAANQMPKRALMASALISNESKLSIEAKTGSKADFSSAA
jgi:hypothetical protein